MSPAQVAAKLQHFNEWRRGHHDDTAQPDPREIGEAIDAAVEMIDRLELAESSVAWHRRRWMALQMHQTKMREPERTMICDILANGELMHPTVAGDRYALPGAQNVPSVPACAESIAMYRKARDERDALRALVDILRSEISTLRAKIEQMERQEPVATVRLNAINGNPSVDFVPGHRYLHHNDKLYLAPGAKGETK